MIGELPLIGMAVRGKIELYISMSILTELAKKLKEKFQWDEREITNVLKHLTQIMQTLFKNLFNPSMTRRDDLLGISLFAMSIKIFR